MSFLFGGSGSTTTSGSQSTNSSTHQSPQYEAYVNNILSKAQALGETPFKKYDIDKMFADFTPDQQKAFEQVRGNQDAWRPQMDQAKGALDKVAGYDPLAASKGALDAAGNAINPWEAGSGAINDSMQGWNNRDVQAGYMDPYTEGAINRADEITTRNFAEKVMPTINSQFAKGMGQLGRGNYNKFAGNAVRDLGNEMSGNAQTMMDKAYWSGANVFGQDQARKLQAGQAAGNLASQNIGTLSNLAKTQSDITTGAVNTGMGIASAYGQQAGALSNLNLQNTNALMAAGQLQQQQAQRPLTAAYQQFQQEQQWPFEMINFMNAAQRGLQIPTSQSSQTISSQTQGSSSSPSALGTAVGLGSAAMGIPGVSDWMGGQLGGLFGGGGGGGFDPSQPVGSGNVPINDNPNYIPGVTAARGGHIKERMRRGGAIRRYARGGPIRRGFAVGGDVPVMRGVNSRAPVQPPMPMGPPAMPPAMPPLAMPPNLGALSAMGGAPPPPPMGALARMGG